MKRLTSTPTRYFFFTGKGGVGKTSTACAVSIALADRGARVLLVSTDPASNLDEVLQVQLGSDPRPVPGVERLLAANIDPEAAAAAYREKMVGPYRALLPAAAVTSMEEQLSGSCTMEIAAFDEFSRLLGDPAATAGFDHVVFDTAPTGHTLRLLSLPKAWSGFLEDNTSGTSCLGPLAGLQAQRELYERTLRTLSDPERTTLVLVSRPEVTALREAERTSGELRALAVTNQHLVLNGLFRAASPADATAVAFERRATRALESFPAALVDLPRSEVSLSAEPLIGAAALRRLADGRPAPRTTAAASRAHELPPPLATLVRDLAGARRGVVMTMGKGGVGKTTIAAAIAVELAHRGHHVHLTTTDPAAHVSWTLGSPPPNLKVSRIDPVAETRAYTEEVMRTAGANLDAQGKALLEEDLRSPCTEEIAVFRAFASAVAEGENGFVVLDTAPTGHTILLLDAAEAYHREVLRQATAMPESVKKLLPRLRDPGFTRVLIVTLAEATPVHEAAALQADLRRAEIAPFAWVVNQSLAPVETADPVLGARRESELAFIEEIRDRHATRTVLVPWMPEAPSGVEGLRTLTASAGTVEAPRSGGIA
ncbi:arsenical pump-driving ATPase [Anaeromyxobacter sp. PSR-1]|uniref:arsenical pump-driving ATPase n=1 Tax=Anaeromyxobacter sp. PSR-1 TaxID=1300915 RepID=UPI0005DD9A5D|nr:arsenical pump-driving ATPase [Anaeromyxobacter sp. PSR-1]GAO01265.1 arsenical pump-driving ATPase [Anaeromyxobacter sp. PSR-1]